MATLCKSCGSKHHSPLVQTKHHRKPKRLGGKGNKKNISIIPEHKHHAWNILTNFNQLLPHQIAEVINEVYLDPEFEFICVKKKGGTKC